MIIPVRCITCGRPLAGLWQSFKERLESGEKAKSILDDFGLDRYCCRSLLMTHKDILPEVAKFRA